MKMHANGKTLPNLVLVKVKISPYHREYVRMEAVHFACVGTRLSAREQLCACVKWDLVNRDFFIFPNFVR